jgi:hypothetical protein
MIGIAYPICENIKAANAAITTYNFLIVLILLLFVETVRVTATHPVTRVFYKAITNLTKRYSVIQFPSLLTHQLDRKCVFNAAKIAAPLSAIMSVSMGKHKEKTP